LKILWAQYLLNPEQIFVTLSLLKEDELICFQVMGSRWRSYGVDLKSLLAMIFPGTWINFLKTFIIGLQQKENELIKYEISWGQRSRLYLDYLEILVGRVSSEPLD
jgi:hypothetical protein